MRPPARRVQPAQGAPAGFDALSALSEDSAPCARLVALRTQAALTHPGAPPEQLGGSPRPRQPASGRPKVEDAPLPTPQELPEKLRAQLGMVKKRPLIESVGLFQNVSAQCTVDVVGQPVSTALHPEDTAPYASLGCLKARAAPMHTRAPLEQLGSSPWPPQLASGRPKDELLSFNHQVDALKTEVVLPQEYVVVQGQVGHQMYFIQRGLVQATPPAPRPLLPSPPLPAPPPRSPPPPPSPPSWCR